MNNYMNELSEFYNLKSRIKEYSKFYMDGSVYVMEIFDIKLRSIDYLLSPHNSYTIDLLVSKFIQKPEYMDKFNKISGRLQKNQTKEEFKQTGKIGVGLMVRIVNDPSTTTAIYHPH